MEQFCLWSSRYLLCRKKILESQRYSSLGLREPSHRPRFDRQNIYKTASGILTECGEQNLPGQQVSRDMIMLWSLSPYPKAEIKEKPTCSAAEILLSKTTGWSKKLSGSSGEEEKERSYFSFEQLPQISTDWSRIKISTGTSVTKSQQGLSHCRNVRALGRVSYIDSGLKI